MATTWYRCAHGKCHSTDKDKACPHRGIRFLEDESGGGLSFKGRRLDRLSDAQEAQRHQLRVFVQDAVAATMAAQTPAAIPPYDPFLRTNIVRFWVPFYGAGPSFDPRVRQS